MFWSVSWLSVNFASNNVADYNKSHFKTSSSFFWRWEIINLIDLCLICWLRGCLCRRLQSQASEGLLKNRTNSRWRSWVKRRSVYWRTAASKHHMDAVFPLGNDTCEILTLKTEFDQILKRNRQPIIERFSVFYLIFFSFSWSENYEKYKWSRFETSLFTLYYYALYFTFPNLKFIRLCIAYCF